MNTLINGQLPKRELGFSDMPLPERRVCPKCGSPRHVEQDLPRNSLGRLDVFAESTLYTCFRFGPPDDRGCGHRWDSRNLLAQEALVHLKAAESQMLATDDEIICAHVREAIRLLEGK